MPDYAIGLYSPIVFVLAIRKYEFLSKGPEGPTWKNSGLQKSEPEGFSLGSTQGGPIGVSVTSALGAACERAGLGQGQL